MIILAHVGPPKLIFQLRNFDVPLMVLASGMSFALSYRQEGYARYVWKRIKRLLFPVWVFLTGYFLFIYATGYISLPDTHTIITSYLLTSGIGYVWIIRIFLSVALVAPFIYSVSRKMASDALFFSALGAAYIGYELLLFISKPYLTSPIGKLFEMAVLYVVPYAIVFAVGLRFETLSRRQVLGLAGAMLGVFCMMGTFLFFHTGKMVATQAFKYPPSAYYLSYALAVSGFLWLVLDYVSAGAKESKFWKPVLFIARNSFWIYLWHIPFLAIQLPYY